MNWYLQSGKESDIAINTRIRFSRNIQGYNFHLSPKELQELENKIKDNIYQIGYGLRFLKLEDMEIYWQTLGIAQLEAIHGVTSLVRAFRNRFVYLYFADSLCAF